MSPPRNSRVGAPSEGAIIHPLIAKSRKAPSRGPRKLGGVVIHNAHFFSPGRQLTLEFKTKYSDWPINNLTNSVKSIYAESDNRLATLKSESVAEFSSTI